MWLDACTFGGLDPCLVELYACRHRNLVTDTKGEASLGACITGTGPAHAELRHTDAGATEVVCTARTAGDYVLSVFDLSSGASLFGSPYQVTLKRTSI